MTIECNASGKYKQCSNIFNSLHCNEKNYTRGAWKEKKKELHSSSQFNSSIGCAIRYNCFGINMNWNGIHFVNKLQIFLEGGTM